MNLDDRHKKNIYKVPDNYFDGLPGRIQKKVEAEKRTGLSVNWSFTWKLTAPVFATVLLVILWINFNGPGIEDQSRSYQEILDEVDTESMVSYLELQGTTSDEILMNIDPASLDESFGNYGEEFIIEDEAMDDELIDALIDEYGLGV